MVTLQRGKKHWIAYYGQGEASEQVIHVREVSPGAYGKTYLRASCELAGEEGTFRLDRTAGHRATRRPPVGGNSRYTVP